MVTLCIHAMFPFSAFSSPRKDSINIINKHFSYTNRRNWDHGLSFNRKALRLLFLERKKH